MLISGLLLFASVASWSLDGPVSDLLTLAWLIGSVLGLGCLALGLLCLLAERIWHGARHEMAPHARAGQRQVF